MKPQDAIDKLGAGNVAATAKVLDCTPQAVYAWLKRGKFPELYNFRAEAALAALKKKTRKAA